MTVSRPTGDTSSARRSHRRIPLPALILALLAPSLPGAAAPREERLPPTLRQSVVKLHVTAQRPNYAQPWESVRPGRGTGSGFIVSRRRILTNAHVVSDARFIEVQRDASSRRFRAEVAFAAHDCDLALLEVREDADTFFRDTREVAFATALPRLMDTVVVLGYPMGGDRLSVTRGVVSRIDYSLYSHSGIDEHLVLQVDAAINPGNSGGPVTYEGRVVGLAFQGIAGADNIGYAIPLPVIERFLEDVKDGIYHGYPELGVGFQELANPALRRHLNVPDHAGGIAVSYLDPFGAARGHLQAGDVLARIDGHSIESDGTVTLHDNRVLFAELLERKQWGDTVRFQVYRGGVALEIPVPLRNPPDPFAYRMPYDAPPRYLVHGGLVFTPLSRALLQSIGRDFGAPRRHRLLQVSRFAKQEGLHESRDELVVLLRRLPHALNAYADPFLLGILDTVNDQPVRNLEQAARALDGAPAEGFHRLRFLDEPEPLILDTAWTRAADASILETYGVPARARLAGEP